MSTTVVSGRNGVVVELDELKLPKATRSDAEGVIAITDTVCLERLDAEYADLARRLVGKLARKRPSPLARGDLRIWAAGVLYALGQVNFLFDRSQSPHMSADGLSTVVGVKKTTMANKAKLVRDAVGLGHFDPEWLRRDLVERNPLVWLLEVDGILVDARRLPAHLQVQAFAKGLIPYLPGHG